VNSLSGKKNKYRTALLDLLLDGSCEDLKSVQICSAFGNYFSGNKAVIILSNPDGVAEVFSSGVEDFSVQAYEQHFHKLDPMKSCKFANKVLRIRDVISDKEFYSSEFHNDFFKPMDSLYSLSLSRKLEDDTELEIAINRGKKQHDFDSEEKSDLKKLGAILVARFELMRKAAQISTDYRHHKLELLSTLSARELEVFLHVSSGAALVEFAQKKNVSINTVRSILKSVLTKLEAHSQIELVKIANVVG